MKNSPENKIKASLIWRIFSYAKPHKMVFYSAVLLTVFLAAISIVRPLIIGNTLNEAIAEKKDINMLNQYCLLLLFFVLIEALTQYINTTASNYLGQSIVKDMRREVYAHILKFKHSYFDKSTVGTLVTRAVSDIESLSNVFSDGFILISGDILMLLIFISVMLWKNWILALLVLSTVPLLLIATRAFKNGIKKTFTEVRNAVASLNSFTQEHLSGMRIVQLFNKETDEMKKFETINNNHRKANIRSIFYYSVFFPVVEILSSISIALLIWFTGIKNKELGISLGDITFFIMLTHMLFRPIRMLADRLNTLQMGIVSAERVFNILDTKEFIEDKGSVRLESFKKGIEFKNVGFSYREASPVLENISFFAEKGKTLAIIGSTGSGKSTIINLLGRFYEHNYGDILIDDIPIQNYNLKSLREKTAVVMQDVFLFNDTIINNISLYNPKITPEKVQQAIKEIGLEDFLNEIPGGLDYIVKERGAMLSAGQRQLIAFLRAYVYEPEIFVLDEATASIDSNTERLISKAYEKLSKNRTSIIIAHRLSTVKNADWIIVLDKGKIIEQGVPLKLLNSNCKFKEFYEIQQLHY